MAGMMTEALQGQQQPSPGPGMQTPPAGPPAGSAGPTPGQPEQMPPEEQAADGSEQQSKNRPTHKSTVEYPQLQDEAIQIVYGDRFDQLIQMFQKNGPDKFARSVAITVNTAIDELEKRHGLIGPENSAKVGMAIYVRILEDMLTGDNPVLSDVPMQQIQETLPATLYMYQESRQDVSKEDMQNVMIRVMEAGDPDMEQPDISGVVPGGE